MWEADKLLQEEEEEYLDVSASHCTASPKRD
jgi:hypothetical protein